jgi:cobalt-zinc-cadmium efflux system protein
MDGHHHHHHTQHAAHAAGRASERRIAATTMLTGGFMLAEVAGGIVSGSLALLADAGHMLTDFASLALAWLAIRISRRPATWKHSYGFDRFSVLAAFVNGLALFAIALWICWEAAWRFVSPGEILGGLMFWVALAGLGVNAAALWILSRGASEVSLNVRAAALHVTGDLLGSVGAIVAAIVIMTTGWTPIDPILSVVVAVMILRSAWPIVAQSGHILLEGAPSELESWRIASDLARNVPGVVRVHHVHAWSISEGRPMVTLEVDVEPDADAQATRRALKARLQREFGVSHATVEITDTSDGGEAHSDRIERSVAGSPARCGSQRGTAPR